MRWPNRIVVERIEMAMRRRSPLRTPKRYRYSSTCFIVICIIVVILLVSLVWKRNDNKPPDDGLSAHPRNEHRIAILIPFLSKNLTMLPPYFPIFLQTARGSSSLVDFIIFHNGQLTPFLTRDEYDNFGGLKRIQGYSIPNNVKFINLQSMKRMGEYFLRVIDERSSDGIDLRKQQKLLKMLCHFLSNNPYGLVEFKPALGYIFQEFIPSSTYTHWGYTDLDIAFGDLPRWITRNELEEYDVVTYGYGDQHRVYLRGQFTFHKNTMAVNKLWNKCEYLTKMDERFSAIASGKERFQLQSAEGCYSHAVIRTPNIRVKYAVKAWTDAKEHNYETYDYGVAIATGRNKDKSVIYKAATPQSSGRRKDLGNKFLQLSPTWFDGNNQNGGDYRRGELQFETGKLIPLPNPNEPGCMFWVRGEYQTNLCFEDSFIGPNDTVFLIDGILFKQSFVERGFPEGITSKALFHFQEWKRVYRSSQLLAFSPHDNPTSNDTSDQESKMRMGWILFPEGSVPLLLDIEKSEAQQEHVAQLRHRKEREKAMYPVDSFVPPPEMYCLVRAGRKSHSSTECDYAVSWRDPEVMVFASDDWYHVKEDDVSLILTLTFSSSRTDRDELNMDVLETNFMNWNHGPVVIMIYVHGSPRSRIDYIVNRIKEIIQTRSFFLVGIIMDDGLEPKAVTWVGLLTMAECASRSRWTISGLNLERGLVLSLESSLIAQEIASLYAGERGSVFLLPQVASVEEIETGRSSKSNPIAPPSITDLFATNKDDITSNLANVECKPCQRSRFENKYDERLYRTWWKLTKQITSLHHSTKYDMSNIVEGTRGLANDIGRLGADMSSLLLKEKVRELLHFDKHPLFMMDSKGPVGGLKTSQVISEIVDLDEKKCAHALRLARLSLLNYTIMPLPGAFAISLPHSRVACSYMSKKCDKCENKHINDIVVKETILSGKFAWMMSMKRSQMN